VVTHPTTNSPIQGLYMAERTGCLFLLDLWSYVIDLWLLEVILYGLLSSPSSQRLRFMAFLVTFFDAPCPVTPPVKILAPCMIARDDDFPILAKVRIPLAVAGLQSRNQTGVRQ
jgi:hypothetical protein